MGKQTSVMEPSMYSLCVGRLCCWSAGIRAHMKPSGSSGIVLVSFLSRCARPVLDG